MTLEISLQEGILHISQSSFSADFPLTGSGESYADCGHFFTVGCLNVDGHHNSNLDGVNMEGKAVIQRRKTSCHRSLCPKCWQDWANRETDKAVQRLKSFSLKGRNLKPIHVVVSVPHVDYGLDLPSMRKKVYRVLKNVHMLGGMMIYHSKRKRKNGSEWYFSPHFHIIGYGWLTDIHRNYVYSGYLIKNIGVRKRVGGVIYYQLSHAGISENHHTVTWFGCLSYGKLHVKYRKDDPVVCPLCRNRLHQLLWIGKGDPELLDVEGITFYDDPSNWIYRPMKRWNDD